MVGTPCASRSTLTAASSPRKGSAPSSLGRLAHNTMHAAATTETAIPPTNIRLRSNHLAIALSRAATTALALACHAPGLATSPRQRAYQRASKALNTRSGYHNLPKLPL